MRSLVRLLPYYRPYRRAVLLGLLLTILSSALASVPPRFVQAAVDGMRADAPMSQILLHAGAIVGITVVAGVMRFGMRHYLNGLSRGIEYDLRNDLFARLTELDATFYGRNRTGDLMARLTNDLSAVRQASGPAVMYLASTVFGGHEFWPYTWQQNSV